MKWVIYTLLASAWILNFYCGYLYVKILEKGLTSGGRRLSFRKLNIALKNAKTDMEQALVKKTKIYYILFVATFYVGLIGFIILMFWSR